MTVTDSGSCHRHTNGRRSKCGFTLLEVLVATAILGTAVSALFGVLSGALSNMRRIEGPERVMMLAGSKLNELLASRGEPESTASGERLRLNEMSEGRWDENTRWQARAERLYAGIEATPGQMVPVRIRFETFWRREQDRAERQFLLETVQLWSNPQ